MSSQNPAELELRGKCEASVETPIDQTCKHVKTV